MTTKIYDLSGNLLLEVPGDSLRGAGLSAANLTDADLTDADLTAANLTAANLTWADMAGANLTWANLTDANLTDANLTRADLTDANLTHTNLTGAHLRGAAPSREQLDSANMSAIQADICRILALAPTEVPRLLEALRAGRINGSASEGECAGLVGTLSAGNNISIPRDFEPPAERWFMAIKEGDTPETSAIAAVTAAWIGTWLDAQ